MNIKVGDVVKLKSGVTVGKVPEGREDNKTAKVERMLEGVDGGFVTDRDLGGMKFWNVDDVEVVNVKRLPSATTVTYVGLVRNPCEKTWRVSLRNENGNIIRDDTGQYEMSDHGAVVARKEAKRLAKFYGVAVREGDKA